jgi:hypothetical protein
MVPPFYERAGSLLSPGDIFETLPHIRVPSPIRIARKIRFTLPRRWKFDGELREILEVGKHHPDPEFDFDPRGDGEETLSIGKMSKAIFLTWGSEVEDDERSGKLHKKDWLIAPVFPLLGLQDKVIDTQTGETLSAAILAAKSPRYFPLKPFPGEAAPGYYVDFRKICPLAATHFQNLPRTGCKTGYNALMLP